MLEHDFVEQLEPVEQDEERVWPREQEPDDEPEEQQYDDHAVNKWHKQKRSKKERQSNSE